MKKFRNLIIGGIETKVFNLIAITAILLTVTFMSVAQYQARMLSSLAEETSARQQESITGITESLMDEVVKQSMNRDTELEAMIVEELFHSLGSRVEMLGRYAESLYANPENTGKKGYGPPNPRKEGEATAQLILADGVDGTTPELAARLGLTANMTDMMISVFEASVQTNSCFVALPEGALLLVDDHPSSKYEEDGTLISFDARTRSWYRQAVEAGRMIFTDVETDAFTGNIEIVCAMPVYSDGRLEAVVGANLFLTSMQEAVESSDENGGFVCVVNQNGHVVFSPKTEGIFRVCDADEAEDLRRSENMSLAGLVSNAMQAKTGVRKITLEDGTYYMAGAPMKTVGWSLLYIFSQESADRPVEMLQESFTGIQEEAVAAYRGNSARTNRMGIMLLAVLAVLLTAASLLLGKRIVKPLNAITKRISQINVENPEFKMDKAFRTGDEIEVLAQSFAAISHKTVEYVRQVKKITAEKERVSVELQLSHDIQVNMLPNIFPAFPERKEFDIYASMLPAKEVGGDFYDFYLVDDSHLVMVIADVSGKGIPAAMFMMASKIIINNISTMGVSDPAQILEAANRQITSNNPAEMFITVWLGILNIQTGLLTAANAGHEYPCLMRKGGRFALYKDRHGFVLGGMEGSQYHSYEVQLYPGDAVFVYTDGVSEANNAKEELFGTGRLEEALNRDPEASCKQLLENVSASVAAFVEEEPQFDDTTMLAVRYNGPVEAIKEVKRDGSL